jgi:hypothetical protein
LAYFGLNFNINTYISGTNGCPIQINFYGEKKKMKVDNKDKTINAIINDLKGYKGGFLLTLNAIRGDVIKLEENTRELCKRLNRFCYGRQYKRREKEFRSVGVTETGDKNEGLHVHLLIMHNNDTRRTFPEIDSFIRGAWYSLMNADPKAAENGNLVDLRSIFYLEGLTRYITKEINKTKFIPFYC